MLERHFIVTSPNSMVRIRPADSEDGYPGGVIIETKSVNDANDFYLLEDMEWGSKSFFDYDGISDLYTALNEVRELAL